MNDAATRVELDSWSANQHAALRVAQSTQRRLAVFTYDLEPQVLGTPEFVDALRAIATSSRYAAIRVLVQDSARAVREGHRLVELARRLSSFIEIRNPHPDHRNLIDAFIVADERALLYRKQADGYDGYADFDAPIDARRLLKSFDEVWHRATPDPEMRRLGL